MIDECQGDLPNAPDVRAPRVNLTFVGVPERVLCSSPLAQHFAEKLRASTRPRPQDGRTRVKDLLDISLLTRDLGLQPSEAAALIVRDIFVRYGSHDLPIPQRRVSRRQSGAGCSRRGPMISGPP